MTREEALNKVRQMSLPKETMEILEALAPELAESEDERIKNLIYCIVRDRSDVGKLLEANGCPVEKALSWIEKQKEQKPVDEQFPPLEGLDKIKAKYYDEGFKNGFDEGVESVKSAEWREEGEK